MSIVMQHYTKANVLTKINSIMILIPFLCSWSITFNLAVIMLEMKMIDNIKVNCKLQLILSFSLERSAPLRATVANWLCSKSAFFTSWVVRISVTKQSLQLFSLRGRIRLPRRKYMPAVEFLSLTMMDCIKVSGSWYCRLFLDSRPLRHRG